MCICIFQLLCQNNLYVTSHFLKEILLPSFLTCFPSSFPLPLPFFPLFSFHTGLLKTSFLQGFLTSSHKSLQKQAASEGVRRVSLWRIQTCSGRNEGSLGLGRCRNAGLGCPALPADKGTAAHGRQADANRQLL